MTSGVNASALDNTRVRLQVDGLCFAYPSRPVFSQWCATFEPGLHLVCGDDGSGKTTLFRLLAADLPALSGRLQLGEFLLSDDPPAYRRQVFRTDPASDAFEQQTPMAWFALLRERYPAFDMVLAAQLLKQLYLTPHLDKTGHMMSTGSRRKVWLAAALASGATVVLIDQPFAALDTPSIRVVTELLQQTANAAKRIVVIADYEAPAGLTFARIHALA